MPKSIEIRPATGLERQYYRIEAADAPWIVKVDGEQYAAWFDDYGSAHFIHSTYERIGDDMREALEVMFYQSMEVYKLLDSGPDEDGYVSRREQIRQLCDRGINTVASLHSAIHNPEDRSPTEPKLADLESFFRAIRNVGRGVYE